MLHFALIGFIVQFVSVVQCLDAVNTNQSSSADKLLFVHALCRHAARNIIEPYPNDLYKDESFWDGGYGQITNVGKREQFQLGQYLRSRYEILVGDGRYSSKKIYIQSTDSDRTLTSALLTLAGLFPPNGSEIWNEHIQWQPIPVHTIPMRLDHVLAARKPCDHLNYIMDKHVNSSEYSKIFEENRPLLDALNAYTGKKLETLHQIIFVESVFFAEISKGFKLSRWVHEIMGDNSDFHRLVFKAFEFYTHSDEMKKFFSGFLLKEILDRFSSKLESTLNSDRLLWFYFAHDLQIQYMLNSLGIDTHRLPPYSSCLFFELYQSDSDPYVKLFYKNSTETDNIPLLQIPNCGSKCPLKKLYELYAHILPKRSHAEECVLRDGEEMPTTPNIELFPL